jgi:DNA-directed RNA polymerase sigma subunit (sigma70/sigma32)
VSSEEVERVTDAIDALGEIGDAKQRARDLSELLDQWPDQHARIRAMRKAAFEELNKKGGMTYRQIAAEFGISVARVGQIMTGVTNPRTQKNPPPPRRPRKKPDDQSAE